MGAPPLWVWHHASMLDHHPDHQQRPRHPERAERLDAALEGARAHATQVHVVEPQPIEAAHLATVHTDAHIDRVLGVRGRQAQLDPDTGVSPGSVDAALLAAGAARQAAVTAMTHPEAPAHLCLVRPPGHHAEPDRAMGFCLFSNLALGVEAALEQGAARAVVIDWDVHHGNGTQAAFYDRADVLVIDVHQDRHYPGTGGLAEIGRGEGEGTTINVPVPAGFGDAEIEAIFDRLVIPAARRFAPDIVFVAAGFDAHRDDPLGGLELTAAGYGRLAERVRNLAHDGCQGRLVATLEGGYELAALRDSVGTCARAWSQAPESRADAAVADAASGATDRRLDALVAAVRRHQGDHLLG